MIFLRENIKDIIEELEPLLQLHYSEVAWNQSKIPLVVNKNAYYTMEENGMIVCFTARVAGNLVGYAAFFMSPHPHYAMTLYGSNDVVFLHPAHRGHGMDFITYCEKELRDLGRNVITLHVKNTFNFGPAIEKLGYELTDLIYQKWLGD